MKKRPSEGPRKRGPRKPPLSAGRPPTFTAAMAARIINWPVDEWPGNCWAVAEAIRLSGLVPGARSQYGIYGGPIADGSYFDGRAIARHGWLRLDDGTILDPTRWVFEGLAPEITTIPPGDPRQDEYDLGASTLRGAARAAAGFDQPPGPAEPPCSVPAIKWPKSVLRALQAFYADTSQLTNRQLQWAAGLSPGVWGASAKAFYMTLAHAGLRVLIPIDYRTEVCPEINDPKFSNVSRLV